MTERERHDFTASELTDLRGLHEATVAALQTANVALEESIRIQQQLYATQQRLYARIATLLGEAVVGRPRVAPQDPSDSKISLHDSTRR